MEEKLALNLEWQFTGFCPQQTFSLSDGISLQYVHLHHSGYSGGSFCGDGSPWGSEVGAVLSFMMSRINEGCLSYTVITNFFKSSGVISSK